MANDIETISLYFAQSKPAFNRVFQVRNMTGDVDIINVLEEGVKTYRKNTLLALPHVLAICAIIGLTVAGAIVGAIATKELVPIISSRSLMEGVIITLLASGIITALLVLGWIIIPGFFQATSIEMTDAALAGRGLTNDMAFSPQSSKAMRLIGANAVISFFAIIVSIFLIAANLILHIDLNVIFLACLGVFMMFYPYRIVLSDDGIVDSIQKGAKMFWDNKMPVALLWVFVYNVAALISGIGMALVIGMAGIGAIMFSGMDEIMLHGANVRIIIIVTLGIGFLFIMIGISTLIIAPLKILWETLAYRRLTVEKDR